MITHFQSDRTRVKGILCGAETGATSEYASEVSCDTCAEILLTSPLFAFYVALPGDRSKMRGE